MSFLKIWSTVVSVMAVIIGSWIVGAILASLLVGDGIWAFIISTVVVSLAFSLWLQASGFETETSRSTVEDEEKE